MISSASRMMRSINSFTVGTSWIRPATMPQLQAPASKELGIAISDFALAISVQQVAWGVSQPIAGIFADKYGTRWVAMIGSALFILGIWLTATAQGVLPIILGAGVLIGVALAWITLGGARAHRVGAKCHS